MLGPHLSMLKLAIYTLSYASRHYPTIYRHPLLPYIPARTSAAAAPPTIHPAFPVIIGTPAVLDDEAPAVPEAVEEPDAAPAAVPEVTEVAEVVRVELPEVVLVADVLPDFLVEVEPVAADVAPVEVAELAALPIAPAVSVTTVSPNSELIFVTVVVVVLDVVDVPTTPFKSPLQTPVFAAVIVQPTSMVSLASSSMAVYA